MGSPRAQRATAEALRDPLPGSVINGKFRVGALLARGGMGRVYLAEQVPLGRPVALKVLRSNADDLATDPNFQKRFFLEASILAKLQHPNIVTLYDYGQIEGATPEQYFMAMEFLAGDTLSARLRKLGSIPPLEALGLFVQMARGLREAHKHGAVHRDLKPENMMLLPGDDGADLLKLVDFGIGKLVNGEFEELTQEGVFVGSPKYMAPEQIMSDSKIDERTDVYSLGVIMFECLSGKLPFEGETSVKMMMAHCGAPVPTMASRNPRVEVPPSVETLVRHALEKEPANRPSNMDEVMRELRACEQALVGPQSRAITRAERRPIEAPTALPPPPVDSPAAPVPPEAPSIEPIASTTGRPAAPRPPSTAWQAIGVIAGLAAASAGTIAMFVAPRHGPRGASTPMEVAEAAPPIERADPALPLVFELPAPADDPASAPADAADAREPPTGAPPASSDPSRPAPRVQPPAPRPAVRSYVPGAGPQAPPVSPPPDIKTTR